MSSIKYADPGGKGNLHANAGNANRYGPLWKTVLRLLKGKSQLHVSLGHTPGQKLKRHGHQNVCCSNVDNSQDWESNQMIGYWHAEKIQLGHVCARLLKQP